MMFQLRYLQTLNSISAENNSTIVFPVPIDIMSSFMPPATGDVSILYLIWNDGMHHFIPLSYCCDCHLLLWMFKMQNIISPVVTNFLMLIQGTILETCCKLQRDLNSIFLSPHVTVAFALLFCRWQAIRSSFSTSESKSDDVIFTDGPPEPVHSIPLKTCLASTQGRERKVSIQVSLWK